VLAVALAVRPPAVSEWTGLKSFPAATQASLQALLGELRAKRDLSEVTVLLLGKSGAGKSSTVNSVLGERVATVSAFAPDVARPLAVGRSAAGFTLHVVDTPGLLDGDAVSAAALASVAAALAGKPVHAVLYVDRLDAWRVDGCDKAAFQALTDTFGPGLWERATLALTHGQMLPPDGSPYADFVARRHAALRAAIVATLPKSAAPQPELPLALVENSGRCAANDGGEKVLPDGTVWLTALMERVTAAAAAHVPYVYRPEEVHAVDPNKKHRWAILPLLLLQAFVLRPALVAQMQRDGEPGHDAD
jgi:hypothetical protein